ncbi:MAG: hypothetical protein IPO67_00955 [Deltaproteobacteria bacterium]|nr:hypothetical protein [Deltaproteobacteria bacterium]
MVVLQVAAGLGLVAGEAGRGGGEIPQQAAGLGAVKPHVQEDDGEGPRL